MDFFKVNPGLSRIWPILRTSYETATGQNKKYKRKSRSGLSYFAVCPICDNPIQLIGLYRDTAESGRKPYGKHCRHTVPDLAEYDEDAYLDCPYSDPNRTPPTSRCKLESRISKQILQLLHDQFDRVMYILSKDTGIYFSQAMAEKMLQSYISREGWSFRDAASYNLPWTFVEGQAALPLFGQRIRKGCALYDAIAANCPTVCFDESTGGDSVRIQRNPGQYVDLNFTFVSHIHTVQEDHLNESIDLWVHSGEPPDLKTVYRAPLQIQTDYFLNLIALSDERSHRNQRLLEIAHELLKDML